jgi:hypothetical protein
MLPERTPPIARRIVARFIAKDSTAYAPLPARRAMRPQRRWGSRSRKDPHPDLPPICYAMTRVRRTEPGRPVASI